MVVVYLRALVQSPVLIAAITSLVTTLRAASIALMISCLLIFFSLDEVLLTCGLLDQWENLDVERHDCGLLVLGSLFIGKI